ncbi:hypothetical protein ABT039_22160 [Streptomyces lasiicapitis]|uniref:hypothetical protein n=1 Tax=Streptomyces lasiicapitis TaxID=1923961 RepID=UPI0033294989
MRIRHALLPLAAAAGLLFTTATSAQAGSDGPYIWDPTMGAVSWFKHRGDVFWSGDHKSDGHSAVTRVYVPAVGIADNLWNPDGKGADRYKGYGHRIPEGTTVYYQACIGEFGPKKILRCSDGWTHGIA